MLVAPLRPAASHVQKRKAAGYQRVTRLFDDMHDVCHSTVCRNQRSGAAESGHRLVEDVGPARKYTADADDHRELLPG